MGRRASFVFGVLTLILAVVVAFVAFTSSERQAAASKRGQVTALETPVPLPPSTPSSEPTMTPSQEVSASPATMRRVPASPMIGLDVSALSRSFRVEGVSLGSPITPPFDSSTIADTLYYEANHAVRGADPGTDSLNTVYLAGHTWRDGAAAMNVIDQELEVDDELFVTTVESRRRGVKLRYVVTDSIQYRKSLLPSMDKVWEVAPGRMVILTCDLRDDGGRSTHNRVFFADLVDVVDS